MWLIFRLTGSNIDDGSFNVTNFGNLSTVNKNVSFNPVANVLEFNNELSSNPSRLLFSVCCHF